MNDLILLQSYLAIGVLIHGGLFWLLSHKYCGRKGTDLWEDMTSNPHRQFLIPAVFIFMSILWPIAIFYLVRGFFE